MADDRLESRRGTADSGRHPAWSRTGCLNAAWMWAVASGRIAWEDDQRHHLNACERCSKHFRGILVATGQDTEPQEREEPEPVLQIAGVSAEAGDVRGSAGTLDDRLPGDRIPGKGGAGKGGAGKGGSGDDVSLTQEFADAISELPPDTRQGDPREHVQRFHSSPGEDATLASAVNSTRVDANAIRRFMTPSGSDAASIGELNARFEEIRTGTRLAWLEAFPLLEVLGAGGQGIVFRSSCGGTDGFEYPVAIKAFSPAKFPDLASYEETMRQMARVASKTAQIREPNFVQVQRFERCGPIRVMIMELVDGFDLRRLLDPAMLDHLQARLPADVWQQIEQDIITRGPRQSRLKPAVAMAIIRACLSGLASLHRRSIVHADIKPSNIMLRSPWGVKIIDFGSAIDLTCTQSPYQWTRAYAAPEIARQQCSTRSDLASLGYVLIELLAGMPLFTDLRDDQDILAAKQALPHHFEKHLPQNFVKDKLLMGFCRKLIEPDPDKRFQTAEEADELAFQHADQLACARLNLNVCNRVRRWIDELSRIVPKPLGATSMFAGTCPSPVTQPGGGNG